MLPLPKFTFLCAPAPQTDFAQEVRKLMQDEVAINDLEEPLRLAASALWRGGFHYGFDLTKPEERQNAVLPGANLSFRSFIHKLEDLIGTEEDRDILGRLALAQVEDSGDFEVYSHVLYRDCHNLHNVEPFIRKYGKDEVLCVHFRILPATTRLPCRHIWLPQIKLSEQVSAFQRELQTPVHA